MFNTVVTSDLGEKVAAKYGVETEKTLTGFKFIGEKVAKYEKNHEKNYVFGYEESYGSLISPFVRDKDAPQACLMLAEAACFYKAQGKTLVDVLNDLYEELGFYKEQIKAILSNLRQNKPTEFAGTSVVAWEDYNEAQMFKNGEVSDLVGFTKSDVLKFYLEDGSWIAIRPSGTEPKCKFYYCIKGTSSLDAEKKTVAYQNCII